VVEAVRRKLEALGYAPADWELPVTEEFVAEFERDRDLRLHADYRAFLLAFGGWTGRATCDFLVQPTPNGTGAWIDLFYGHIDSGVPGQLGPRREVAAVPAAAVAGRAAGEAGGG
jgi:hypothetical protein